MGILLPVELHRHFGAGMSPTLVSVLAQKNCVSKIKDRKGRIVTGYDPRCQEDILRYYDDVAKTISLTRGQLRFEKFLDSSGLPVSVILAIEDLEYAAYEQAREQAARGMLHIELRLSPYAYAREIFARPTDTYVMTADIQHVIRAVQHGLLRASRDFNISSFLIVAFSRQNTATQSYRIIEAILNADTPVGFDLAGIEYGFTPSEYIELLAPLRDAGVPITIHVGEQGTPPAYTECPARAISECVTLLGARRIGHGTSAVTSLEVMTFLRDEGIYLECCPLSNVHLGYVPRNSHPLKEFLAHGVKATLSTDDPLMFGTVTVADVAAKCQDFLCLSQEDQNVLTLNAIAGAFVNTETKRKLTTRYLYLLRSSAPNQQCIDKDLL